MMMIAIRPLGSTLTVCAAFVVLTALGWAGESLGDDFASGQDVYADPPILDPTLEGLIDFVGKNGRYERQGGQPFAAPVPPGLPLGVAEILVSTFSGTRCYSTGSTNCCTIIEATMVRLVFVDGSSYIYWNIESATHCGDGYSHYWRWLRDYTIDTDGLSRREYTFLDVTPVRSLQLLGTAGTTLDYSYQLPSDLPLTTTDVDEIEILVAPGGVLDLRGNPAANGPLFQSGGPALIRCDTVLLDPGVVLVDLFSPPPVLTPAAPSFDIQHFVGGFVAEPDIGPTTLPCFVLNAGNSPDVAALSWADDQGWVPAGSTDLSLPAFDFTEVAIPALIPPGTMHGDAASLTVQAASVQNPTITDQAEALVVHDPSGVYRYGTGTPTCAGGHQVNVNSAPYLGNTSFQFTCSNVPPASAGFVFVSPAQLLDGIGAPLLPALFHVDLFAPGMLFRVLPSGAGGTFVLPVALPNLPGLDGVEYNIQFVWSWPLPCGPGMPSITSSEALAFQLHELSPQ
jgi:hypothetical protein